MDKSAVEIPSSIYTPRLLLRPVEEQDAPALHRALLDGYEDLVKWLARPATIPTLEDVEAEIQQSIEQWNSREYIRFAITLKSDGTLIGRMAFPPGQSDWRVPYFGIAYFISKKFSKQGYCSESANALTRFAFGALGARRVEMKVDEENTASVRIPKKLGFELEAVQRGIWPRPDKEELAVIQTYCVFDTKSLPPLAVTWN